MRKMKHFKNILVLPTMQKFIYIHIYKQNWNTTLDEKPKTSANLAYDKNRTTTTTTKLQPNKVTHFIYLFH